MQRHLTMSRKLHEFLDANAGQFSRAAERHAPFAKQFQREKLRGAARRGTTGQAGQREDFFGYINRHVCHTAIKMAQRAAFVKLIFGDCANIFGIRPLLNCRNKLYLTPMKTILLNFGIFILCGLALATNAQTVPALVNYQGRLPNPDGVPLATADYQFTFKSCDSATSNRKPSLEIGMAPNPNPNPDVVLVTPGHGPKVARDADGPEARVFAQPLQLQARMSRILQELLVSALGRLSDLTGQIAIQRPEVRCPPGGHDFCSKSIPLISGKALGLRLYSASTASARLDKAELGLGSRRILCQAKSPSHSGMSAGKSWTNLARSPDERPRMAVSISCSELMRQL